MNIRHATIPALAALAFAAFAADVKIAPLSGGSVATFAQILSNATGRPFAVAGDVDNATFSVLLPNDVPLDLPADEIYTDLEEVSPTMTLMETRIPEGTFPQCCEARTPWGGRVLSFLPGHIPEVTGSSDLLADIEILIEDLLERK